MSALTTTLAADIQRHHDEAQRCAGEAVEHARLAGEALLKAKAEVGHGGWLDWLNSAGFEFGHRTAQNYMRLAKELPKLPEEKRNAVAYLPIRDALEQLTTSSARLFGLDAETRQKVSEVIEQGETTVRDAMRQVKREQVEADWQRAQARPSLTSTVQLNGRPVQIKRNEESQQWAIVVGPNEAGERIDQAITEAKETAEYLDAMELAADSERRAKELEDEAEEMRQAASRYKQDARGLLSHHLRRDAPVYAFTETIIFNPLGVEDDAELKALPQSEIVARLLEIGSAANHDLQGDVHWHGLSDKLRVDADWTGIGFEAGLG